MSRAGLTARVAPRIPALARAMVAAFPREIPVYASLPTEQLQGEVLRICERNLELFFRCVAESRSPTAEELTEPRASAARRAEERVPLDAVLAAYHLGGRIGWRAIADEAAPEEHEELVDVGERVLGYVEALSGTVAAAYLEEQQLIYGEERDARRALADALLRASGEGLSRERLAAVADRAGVPLAEAYAVAALRLGSSPDEQAVGVSAAVAGRRKVRRLIRRLEDLADAPVLTLLDPGGGLVIVPLARVPDVEDVTVAARRAVAAAAAAADADVLAGVAVRSGWARVAEAAQEAREVLHLAGRLGRERGAYGLDDVLLEHALVSPPGVAERLAALVAPLEAKPEFIATLEAWFAADFDRRAAAAALHVHPNTLDYRLRRVGELTGLDPSTARGLQVLGAALTARRVG
jgi:sugar diacid utilization regulator